MARIVLSATMKTKAEDFVVDEVGLDGSLASECLRCAPAPLFTEAELLPEEKEEDVVSLVEGPAVLRESVSEATARALEAMNERGRLAYLRKPIPPKVEEEVFVIPLIEADVESKDARARLYRALDSLTFTRCERTTKGIECRTDLRLVGLVFEEAAFEVLKVCKSSGVAEVAFPEIISDEEKKELRKALHSRLAEKDFLRVDTKTVEGNKVRVEKKANRKRKRGKDREFLVRCVLSKRNEESFLAVRTAGRKIGLGDHGVCTAGVKDKRAETYQFATVDAATPHARKALNALSAKALTAESAQAPDLFSRLVPVARIIQSETTPTTHLAVGDLLANRFKIKLRDVKTKSSSNIFSLTSTEMPFVNFFGAQRVGRVDDDLAAWRVGLAVLKQDYASALDFIVRAGLRERPSSVDDTQDDDDSSRKDDTFSSSSEVDYSDVRLVKRLCRKLRKGSSAADALRAFSRFGDPKRAIDAVPHKTRTMWLHAYQGRLFNLEASARWCHEEKTTAKNLTLPLVGFKTPPTPLQAAELLKDGVTPEDFGREKCNGATRPLFATATHLAAAFHEDSRTIDLDFRLPPGAFATIFLREICDHVDVCF